MIANDGVHDEPVISVRRFAVRSINPLVGRSLARSSDVELVGRSVGLCVCV